MLLITRVIVKLKNLKHFSNFMFSFFFCKLLKFSFFFYETTFFFYFVFFLFLINQIGPRTNSELLGLTKPYIHQFPRAIFIFEGGGGWIPFDPFDHDLSNTSKRVGHHGTWQDMPVSSPLMHRTCSAKWTR